MRNYTGGGPSRIIFNRKSHQIISIVATTYRLNTKIGGKTSTEQADKRWVYVKSFRALHTSAQLYFNFALRLL